MKEYLYYCHEWKCSYVTDFGLIRAKLEWDEVDNLWDAIEAEEQGLTNFNKLRKR